jgi:hypothetical protein
MPSSEGKKIREEKKKNNDQWASIEITRKKEIQFRRRESNPDRRGTLIMKARYASHYTTSDLVFDA